MPIASYGAAGCICRCDHHAPCLRVVRSTAFNTELARFIDRLGLSGDGTVDWILTELFDHRTERLIGIDGERLKIESEPTLTDELFGEDARRTINRYRERSRRPFRNRLDKRLVWPVTIVHFAREIHLCRTSGVCFSR